MSTPVELAEKKVRLYEKKLAQSKQLVIDAIKDTTVPCKKCKVQMKVGEIVAYEEKWYTSPHGCTGGDYWNSTTERWVKCNNPECQAVNRFFDTNSEKDVLKVLDEPYVKKLVSVHGKDQRITAMGGSRAWVQ